MADASKLLVVLLASLAITSLLTSFFVTAVYGYSAFPMFDISSINTELSTENSNKDLQANCSYAEYDTIGSLSCGPEGLYIQNGGFYIKPTDEDKTRGFRKNSYSVTPSGGDYDVIIFKAALGTCALSVRSDGLHIYLNNFLIITRDLSFIPMEGANNIPADITTSYDSSAHKLTVTFNGQTYEVSRDATPNLGFASITAVGGIITNGNILVKSVASMYSQVTDAIDGLKMILAFLGNVIALLGWNIDANILPWEINFMFIKTQIVGIFICLVVIARG